jgi:polar amino acid transport system substrate-binding protein
MIMSNSAPIVGAAMSPAVDERARSELAPTGTLRAGVNLSNALFTKQNAATGELRGVSVDLMRELASRLNVPVDFIVYKTPGDVVDAVASNTWDVAVLAIEPARAERIAFSPAITEIDATYVVHRASPIQSIAQVDSPGVRIAAPEKAGYELFLARTLRQAQVVRTTNFQASIAVFNEGGADALAGLKPALIESMEQIADGRLLEGRFTAVNHGIATQRERRVAAVYLKTFVEAMNGSGFVARSIERHGVRGLCAVK